MASSKSEVSGWGRAAGMMAAYAVLGAGAAALAAYAVRRVLPSVPSTFVPAAAALGAIVTPWLVSGNLRWKAALGIAVGALAVALAAAR
jgi:hypothetical protein